MLIFSTRLRDALGDRKEIDPRQDSVSGTQYVDSDFQPSTGFKRGVLAHKPHVMDYISGDGSHHALNRKLNRQYFPKSSKFSRRFNILDSGALGPVYSRPYSRVASTDPVRYGRQADTDYYNRLLRF